jgi:hypothetical protein
VLRIVVMRQFRQARVHEFDTAAVEESAVVCDCDQYGPTAVIGYAEDGAAVRHVTG